MMVSAHFPRAIALDSVGFPAAADITEKSTVPAVVVESVLEALPSKLVVTGPGELTVDADLDDKVVAGCVICVEDAPESSTGLDVGIDTNEEAAAVVEETGVVTLVWGVPCTVIADVLNVVDMPVNMGELD
mmetsp:Transcript_41142/g.85911  ORF Transcript_41142/g.85911 Transcript_41142/m.85911 type:complete len:131 (+) Transcript_41142:1915-2307(+)